MHLYLAISATTVSAALVREEDRKQLIVYYVSQAFQGAEANYPRIEKNAFALMMDHPIKKSMNKPEAAGRMV